ncbi:hypothetical protein ACTXT7_002328 [Hymenolepis weldensis]
MYIEPELLQELSDEQKQVLFVSMRREQVRRYNEWIQTSPAPDTTAHKKVKNYKAQHVSFDVNSDGEIVADVIPNYFESPQSSPETLRKASILAAMRCIVSSVVKSQSPPAQPVMRKPIQKLNAVSTQPVVQTPINDANPSLLSCDMKARISKFEELDKHAAPLNWKEVKLRAQQQEEKRRKVVVTARRSLHLDVHVGGGESAPSARLKNSSKSSSIISNTRMHDQAKLNHSSRKPSITDIVQATMDSSSSKSNSTFKFQRTGVTSASTLLEASLFARIPEQEDSDSGSVEGPPQSDYRYGTLNRLQSTFGADAIIEWFREFEAPYLLEHTFKEAGGVLKIPQWFHGPLKRRLVEMLLAGREGNSFLLRISDSFLGYIISHVSKEGNFSHVFLHIVKPIKNSSDDSCSNRQSQDESRFYHLQGQRNLFPSLVLLVEYYKYHSILDEEEDLFLSHPVGQNLFNYAAGKRSSPDYAAFLFHQNDKNAHLVKLFPTLIFSSQLHHGASLLVISLTGCASLRLKPVTSDMADVHGNQCATTYQALLRLLTSGYK